MGQNISKSGKVGSKKIKSVLAENSDMSGEVKPANEPRRETLNVGDLVTSGKVSGEELSSRFALLESILSCEDIFEIIHQITGKANSLFDVSAVVIEGMKIPEPNSLKQDMDEEFREIFPLITALAVGKSLSLEQFINSQESTCTINIEIQLNTLAGNNVLGFLYARGYREIQVFKLKKNNELIGLLEYFFKNSQSDKRQNIHLSSSIVINLIAEKLWTFFVQQNQHEQLIHLNLSEATAKVRSKKELSTVLISYVNQFISSASAAIILLYDETQKTFHPWLDGDTDGFKKLLPIDLKIENDPFLQQLAASDKSIIYNIGELLCAFPQTYIQQVNREGFLQGMYVPFFTDDELKGYVLFYTRQKNGFKDELLPFVQRVVDKIAIAVANILANAELQSRAKDKTLLLEISNEMAAIRNKNDLRIVVDEKVKRILLVNNISFCYLNPDGKTFGSFILDENSPSLKHTEYYKIIMAMHSVNDGVANKTLSSELPIVFDIEEVMEWAIVPSYVKMLYEVGMKQLIFSTLRNGDSAIGFLGVTRDNKAYIDSNQLHLIKAVSSQLAVALANIKANEQIERQLEEINNYKEKLKEENLYLQDEINTGFNYGEIIGNSESLREVFGNIDIVARTDTSVLILGETGTGKELAARAIHNLSPRSNKPLIKLNCAALPVQLIESELFGHEKGSFTGAIDKRIGKFELADGSTLFLDELGELPLELQAKILRAIQEQEIERLGSNKVITVNTRIIAATNRNLDIEVAQGRFRPDLYFRLNVFPIHLPPLRERKDDIPLLVNHFIKKMAKKLGREIKGVSDKAMNDLQNYEWPGNIRELEHVVERSIILCKGKILQQISLPMHSKVPAGESSKIFLLKTWKEHEKEYILDVLKKCKGRISGVKGAATILEMPPSTLESKMRKLGIKKHHY
ncbi:MAG: sigma 54-interacting transcriptional regulator [Ferruginibacter sp.]